MIHDSKRYRSLIARLRHLEAAKKDYWQEFMDEKYEGGKKKFPNPNPDTKQSRPTVALSTILTSGSPQSAALRKKIQKEFKDWMDKHPDTSASKDSLDADAKAMAKDFGLDSKAESALTKFVSEKNNDKEIDAQTEKMDAESDKLHKKHLFLGNDPDKKAHPKAKEVHKFTLSLMEGKGKAQLDKMKQRLSNDMDPQKAKRITNWVKSTLILNVMRALDKGKAIPKPL